MTDNLRDVFLRYLHEPHELSHSERLRVKWLLLSSASHRHEYAQMRQMHRSLSRHFATSGMIGVSGPLSLWLRISLFGLVGVILLTGLFLSAWKSNRSRSIQSPSANRVAQRCPRCARAQEQCAHCMAIQRLREGHCSSAR